MTAIGWRAVIFSQRVEAECKLLEFFRRWDSAKL